MKLTHKQKNTLLGVFSIGAILGLMKIDDWLRNDGASKDQEMVLIKKEIINRPIDPMHNYGEGLSPAKQYAKLSFDTDGNFKTAEVSAVPEIECWEGIDEMKGFNLGERRTLEDWNLALEKAGWDRKKSLDWDEGKSALLWRWQRERK